MDIQNITGLENPTEIAKILQALIDQKSTIDLDNLSPEGQAKFTALQNAINANSNSITAINNELSNKLEAEVLKAQNGYIKFSNLVCLQWGKTITYDKIWQDVMLPVSFNNIFCTALGAAIGANAYVPVIINSNYNLSQFQIGGANDIPTEVFWIAIGF